MVGEAVRKVARRLVPRDPYEVTRERDPEIAATDRKLAMGVYIVKLIGVFAIFELMIFAVFVKLMGFSEDAVDRLLNTVNLMVVPGWGITQFIFTGGNVGEWKYRSPYEGGYRYPGNRDYIPSYGQAPKNQQPDTGQLPVEEPKD